jgi:hypothetical protein
MSLEYHDDWQRAEVDPQWAIPAAGDVVDIIEPLADPNAFHRALGDALRHVLIELVGDLDTTGTDVDARKRIFSPNDPPHIRRKLLARARREARARQAKARERLFAVGERVLLLAYQIDPEWAGGTPELRKMLRLVGAERKAKGS